MKKISTYLTFISFFSILTFTRLFGQASCPDIVVSSFQIITDPLNSCLKKVSIDFINPTNGAKSIGVKVACSNTVILTECHDASGQQGVKRNFVTAQFSCCNIAQLVIEIAAYTGNNSCLGTPCITKLSIAGSLLPVQFKSFTASRKSSEVNLNWITASEQNNRGFEIEKQTGTGGWQSLMFMASTAPGGNSISDISYSYIDFSNTAGIANYRIKQIDLDGKIKYSEVRTVQGNNDNAKSVTLFPNPSINGNATIVFKDASASYDVSLTDVNGRMLKQWTSTKGNSLNITNLVPGFYSLRIATRESGQLIVEKLIVTY